MAMSEKTRRVFDYLKANNGVDLTAADVAAALNMEKKSVDGAFTAGIQKKGLGVRVPAEVELEDGTHKQVKFLALTELGMNTDPDADDAE